MSDIYEPGSVLQIVAGTNITISPSNGVGVVTVNSTGGGGSFTWNEITTATTALAVANGYIMNNASPVVGTLPATASEGDEIEISGKGAGGWSIAQNAGQTIHYGTQNTTTGTGGSLSSQNPFDFVELLCITANTDWLAHGSQGNLTVV